MTRSFNRLAAAGVLVAIAAASGAAAFYLSPTLSGREEAGAGVADIGGPFTLTTQTGAKLSDTDLKGKPFALVFGFTRCPEVCPTTLAETSEALNALGPDADKLRVLFVSVDPTRDTPEFLARYLQSFPRITGLTGTEAEIDAVGKEYRAYWKKVPTDDGDYTMDHTATMYLMDAQGRFSGTIAYGEAGATRVAKLKRLVAGQTISAVTPFSDHAAG